MNISAFLKADWSTRWSGNPTTVFWILDLVVYFLPLSLSHTHFTETLIPIQRLYFNTSLSMHGCINLLIFISHTELEMNCVSWYKLGIPCLMFLPPFLSHVTANHPTRDLTGSIAIQSFSMIILISFFIKGFSLSFPWVLPCGIHSHGRDCREHECNVGMWDAFSRGRAHLAAGIPEGHTLV